MLCLCGEWVVRPADALDANEPNRGEVQRVGEQRELDDPACEEPDSQQEHNLRLEERPTRRPHLTRLDSDEFDASLARERLKRSLVPSEPAPQRLRDGTLA